MGLKNSLLPLTGDPPLNGTVDLPHGKSPLQHLGSPVPRTVIHYNNLIELVVQRQQRPHTGFNGDLLVVSGHHNGNRHVNILMELVFQAVAALHLIEGGRSHCHCQKQKAGIADHIGHIKVPNQFKKELNSIPHEPASPSFIRWVSNRYRIISLA